MDRRQARALLIAAAITTSAGAQAAEHPVNRCERGSSTEFTDQPCNPPSPASAPGISSEQRADECRRIPQLTARFEQSARTSETSAKREQAARIAKRLQDRHKELKC